ncbi:MAG: hypothetical protein QOH69_1613 [Actinomycetota bacterium]|jgi:uncharacterized membrane-anchored protein YitT (DUF2179 family)|nr:hypothetical protein [Actinomycetota bacterium]MDQ1552341.1 hypothetical protein [Actinomycetota bacterium]
MQRTPSSQDTMNVFYFIIAFVFFALGIFLFAFAFNVPNFEAILFVGGIASISISLAIPFHIIGHGEQR